MNYKVYHASVTSFKQFEEEKITKSETDAPFNGFWFSNDKTTSSAWVNPKYLKTCNVELSNPCTWKIVRELDNKNIYDCNELRKELLRMGYDGIVFTDRPVINEKELQELGTTTFKTIRGTTYILKINTEYGGIDLYDNRNECITGYDYVEDYLKQQEQVIVSFTSSNIEVLEEINNPYWN